MSAAAGQQADTRPASTETDQNAGGEGMPTPGVDEGQQGAQAAGVGSGGAQGEGTGATDEGEDSNPNREAAKWRTKLRESESQVIQLTEQLSALRDQLIETALPSDVTMRAMRAVHEDMSALLDADGRVDAKAVQEAAEQVRVELGLGARRPEPNPFIGAVGSGGPDAKQQWTDSFAPRR